MFWRICSSLGTALFAAGYALPVGVPPVSPIESESVCSSPQPALEVELEPVVSEGTTFEVAVAIPHVPEDVAAGAYSVTVWDDTGNFVSSDEPVVEENPENAFSTTFQTPDNLPEGFYQIRVNATVAPQEGDPAEAESSLYIQVSEGTAAVLSQEEWRAESAYMEAQPVSSDAGPAEAADAGNPEESEGDGYDP